LTEGEELDATCADELEGLDVLEAEDAALPVGE
jgi:hypothetical protein